VADDYRDPLAAAHARIAELERENETLRRVSSGRAATSGEVEALRLEHDLMRMDMAWAASHPEGADQRQLTRNFIVARFILGATVLFLLACPFVVGLPGGAGISFVIVAVLLVLLIGFSTTAHQKRLRAWDAHQTRRSEIERAAQSARAGSGAPEVRFRVEAADRPALSERTVHEVEDISAETDAPRMRRRQ
jgi:hypothetical protein